MALYVVGNEALQLTPRLLVRLVAFKPSVRPRMPQDPGQLLAARGGVGNGPVIIVRLDVDGQPHPQGAGNLLEFERG